MADDHDIPDICDWPTTDCAFKVRHDQELAAALSGHELAVAAGQEWQRRAEEAETLIRRKTTVELQDLYVQGLRGQLKGARDIVKLLRDAIYGDVSQDKALKAARGFLKETE